jgi:hypothetical protein
MSLDWVGGLAWSICFRNCSKDRSKWLLNMTHLLFAHEDAVGIYNHNFDVILMACTYRTNQFKTPLLNIV